MKLLSLSTAEPGCSLAVMDGTTLVCEEFWTAKATHSRRLMEMIDQMLKKRACLELNEIDGFVTARGPGSFTGLRIGISVLKGMAYALNKPAFGISSLDGIAFRFSHSALPVCAMMDARRNEVYCAVYHFDHGRLIQKSTECVVCPEDAIDMAEGSVLFAGSGSKAYKAVIEQKAEDPVIAHDFLDSVNATALVLSLYSKENFFSEPGNTLAPSYIRKSDAELVFSSKKSGILT